MYCASCDKKFDGNLEFCEFCGTKNPFYGMRCRICNKVINYQKGLRICYSCQNQKIVNLGEENGIKESYGIHYKYTWRSTENFECLEFSKDIKEILIKSLKNDNQILDKNIIDELIYSRICDKSGNLTKNGKVFVISLMSLEQQCNILGIKLEYESIAITEGTEVSALEFYKKKGYQGCINDRKLGDGHISEKSIIRLLLYCLCFDRLFPLHIEKYNNFYNNLAFRTDDMVFSAAVSYAQMIGGYIEYFYKLDFELINIIKNSNEKIVRKNFNEIFKIQYQCNQNDWKTLGFNEDFVLKIYKGLGNEELAKIGILFFKDPCAYSSGWPDLTIVKNNKVKFIEVKRGDKLKRSQIITIGDLIKSTNLDISVLKII